MATYDSGVMPVNQLKFTFTPYTNGAWGTESYVKECESLDISVDGSIEEWTPMNTEGWTNRLLTAKSMTIGLSGKRCYGDTGNDTVYGMIEKVGLDAMGKLSIYFPGAAADTNKKKIEIIGVVNITGLGGESTAVDKLEWEIQSSGKPTFTTYTTPPETPAGWNQSLPVNS
jgi:hypothetical protein